MLAKNRTAALEQYEQLKTLAPQAADKLYAGIYQGKLLSVAPVRPGCANLAAANIEFPPSSFGLIGVPYGSRTRVAAVKGRCPRPLDERDAYGALLEGHCKRLS